MSLQRKNVQSIVLASGLTFLAVYVVFALSFGAIGGLFFATILGLLTLIMSSIMYGIQYGRMKSAMDSKQKAVDDVETHQTRTIEIDLPFAQAFDTALAILHELHDTEMPMTFTGISSKQMLKIEEQNREIGRIRAGLRAKTLGIQDVMTFSKIDIQLQRIDDTTTRLQIESRPTVSWETMDLGRHTHYVNQLAVQIRQSAHQQTVTNRLVEDEGVNDAVHDDNSQDNQIQSIDLS